MKFASVGELRYILPTTTKALPSFMDGGVVEQKDLRQRWPIHSYKSRPPLTAEQKAKINSGHCPKCDSLLRCEEAICGGEKGKEGICNHCGARWYPDAPPEPDLTKLFRPASKRHPVGKKIYREFNCKFCGKLFQGLAARNACYCPGEKCYEDARRIANREAYRKLNNLSRDLGA